LHLRSIVNNKLLVFAQQPIEGGDNVGEIHTLLLITGKRLYSLFTVRITSSWTYWCYRRLCVLLSPSS
jgi:hypothetical protein